MKKLHGNLHLLSPKSYERLKSHYAGNTLTLQEQNSLRNEITARQGYVQGASITRLKDLNPTSRDHIAWILQTFHGWKPTQMTATGKPIIDEVILTEIGSEISMKFARCLTVTKMLGLLSNGTNAWLKLCTNNRIHHHCSVATATHRCAHRSPNLAQVPSDERFRKLFIPSPGMVMVGADLSGIELRHAITLPCTI